MPNPRWTLLVVRRGTERSRSAELSRGRVLVIAAGSLIAMGSAAFAAGWWWGGRAGRAEASALEARVAELTEEKAKTARVAARLAAIEESYRELRSVMGGEIAPSERDVLLPALPAVGEGGDRAGASAAPGVPDLWPLVEEGFVTRAFGDTRGEPYAGHVGMDIAVPSGSYVRASGAGRVEEAREDPEYGRFVRIAHDDGVSSLYAHNSWLFVGRGDTVRKGEVIALSGSTGRSTAPHLHIEIERGGRPVDPMEYLFMGE